MTDMLRKCTRMCHASVLCIRHLSICQCNDICYEHLHYSPTVGRKLLRHKACAMISFCGGLADCELAEVYSPASAAGIILLAVHSDSTIFVGMICDWDPVACSESLPAKHSPMIYGGDYMPSESIASKRIPPAKFACEQIRGPAARHRKGCAVRSLCRRSFLPTVSPKL